MPFQGRYQILEMLSDGEARTFRALQISSGRILLLHELWAERTPPNRSDLASLVLGFLRRATADEMKILIEVGEEGGCVFVVTEDLPICRDLRQWLESAAGSPGAREKASVVRSAPSVDDDLPGASGGLPSQARPESLPSPDTTLPFTTPKVIAGQTSSPSAERHLSAPAVSPEVPVASRTLASPDQSAGPPGGLSEAECRKTFGPPVAPSPPSRAKDEPGEFTRVFFGSPRLSSVDSAVATGSDSGKAESMAQTAPEPLKVEDKLAEFERVFSPAQQATKSSELTGPQSVPSQVSAPIPAPAGQTAPCEFTRVFSGKDLPVPRATGPVPRSLEKPSTPLDAKAEKPPESELPAGFEVVFESRKQPPRPAAQPAVEKGLRPSPDATVLEKGAPADSTQILYALDKSKGIPPSSAPDAERARLTPLTPEQPSRPEGPGEFTRLFQAQLLDETPPAAVSLEAKPSQPLAPPAQQPPASPPPAGGPKGPGEFTLLFSSGPRPTRSAAPPIPASSPRPTVPLSSSSCQQDPGELTQFLRGYEPGRSAPTAPVLERPAPFVPPSLPKGDEARPGAFTLIFQRPSGPATPVPPAAPPLPVVQASPAAPQSPEPDEFMHMFELPSGGAGASPQGASQASPSAATQPVAGRAIPAVPVPSISAPMVPGMPYVQPPVAPLPMVPQSPPYQMPAPQFQPPSAPPPFAVAPPPAMPQMQPIVVPTPGTPQAGLPKSGKSKFLVPLIILGGLFLIAVGLILFFALKH